VKSRRVRVAHTKLYLRVYNGTGQKHAQVAWVLLTSACLSHGAQGVWVRLKGGGAGAGGVADGKGVIPDEVIPDENRNVFAEPDELSERFFHLRNFELGVLFKSTTQAQLVVNFDDGLSLSSSLISSIPDDFPIYLKSSIPGVWYIPFVIPSIYTG
jgi:hypothetical protein